MRGADLNPEWRQTKRERRPPQIHANSRQDLPIAVSSVFKGLAAQGAKICNSQAFRLLSCPRMRASSELPPAERNVFERAFS
jgi:hypothetical protein